MKKFALSAMVLTAGLSLAACGRSDNASDAASAENVEMPAEEAMSGVDPSAAPVAESAPASEAPATVSASEAGATATPAADAAEKATADAEKKM